ncbi:LPS-assembly protein LptD [Arenibacterium halophilum]|uniref:LPS-assembly protein LptD n=1 Tax=Arenibacterium halophilum TaxID=2583821 RepID=A0ABY2XCI7_9RHOB|nr:LPS assembly protein LptD [Arenibacterium halophilum]TMV13564.1 LPS-assembly protein LptD [Arenibacterium halophilum]
MTARRLPLLLATCALLGLAPPALAQTPFNQPIAAQEGDDPAVLVADSVYVTPSRELIAEGNVEAFQGQTRLRAQRIRFDRETGTLTIDGPIRIDEGGEITVLASYAELDRDLQNGLLTGARMVLNQQLQMASLQMTRVGGRYTQLYKTAVTSCHVCGDGRPPLWQIRARKITHDQQEKQLYFEDAQFLIMDVPVMYFPGMRLPDPTLKRATGFLFPTVRSTSNLGTGVRVPYFFRLGDHADLTLSPYVSAKTRTMDFRYRQAFRRGRLQLEGAYTKDDLRPGSTRGYLFGTAYFDLPRGYRLDISTQTTTDNAYLSDYGLPDLDRLRSEVSISRYRLDSAFRARIIEFQSLRDGDNEAELPTVMLDATLEKRYFPDRIGGELRVGLDIHGHHRTSDADVLGRDVKRLTADLSWRKTWTLAGGLRAQWLMDISADTFDINQDSTYANRIDRLTPRAALTFSYPMARVGRNGSVQYLEPIVQLGWTEVHGPALPNDESTFVEFDRGNLLELSRFPAPDRREDGPTLAYGVNWARYAPSGWQISGTMGQVIRKTANPSLTQTSGLSGTTSDVLVAGQIRLADKLSLTARSLMDNAFSLSKAELRAHWKSERTQLSGTYLWLGADAAEARARALSEIWLAGAYDVSQGWTASANLRYDISDARATRAGVGFVYRNECVTVDFSVNRRYTTTTSIEPTTDFGFTIALSGFAVEQGSEKYRRSCS